MRLSYTINMHATKCHTNIHRAPRSKKWNFKTQFLENFRTFLSVSRGSKHRKYTFFICQWSPQKDFEIYVQIWFPIWHLCRRSGKVMELYPI